MRCLFFLIAITAQALCVAHSQKVVMLYGSCSSGKTSLSKQVALLDPNWRVIDGDRFFIKAWLENIAKRFPDEFSVLSSSISDQNLFHAINRNVLVFQEHATELDCHEVREALKVIHLTLSGDRGKAFWSELFQKLDKITLKKVREGLMQNKNILCDCWYLDSSLVRKSFPDISLKRTLVFSPLLTNLENLKKRNQQALSSNIFSEHRFYRQFLISYAKHYRMSNNPEGALFSYKKRKIEEMFDFIQQETIENEGKAKWSVVLAEVTENELVQLQHRFLPGNLKDDEKVYIAPHKDYDSVISTHLLSPHQVALRFMSMFEK